VLTPDGEEDKYIATSYGDNEKAPTKRKVDNASRKK